MLTPVSRLCQRPLDNVRDAAPTGGSRISFECAALSITVSCRPVYSKSSIVFTPPSARRAVDVDEALRRGSEPEFNPSHAHNLTDVQQLHAAIGTDSMYHVGLDESGSQTGNMVAMGRTAKGSLGAFPIGS